MIQNVVGPPVDRDSFFNREADLARVRQRLTTGNVLLLSPRRVGKTSLLFRLQDEFAKQQVPAIYVSAAKARTELELVQELLDSLTKLYPVQDLVKELGRRLKAVRGLELFGVTLTLSGTESPDWRALARELLLWLGQRNARVVMLMDELPVFVLTLIRQDPRGERAREFLEWFRDVRQQQVATRWVIAGSIGLNTVVQRIGLSKTINDLFLDDELGPFSEADAHAFLEQLSVAHDLVLTQRVRERICGRIGWLLPFYLQLLFAEIHQHYTPGHPDPCPDDVDRAYERLVGASRRVYFCPWVERLREELGPPDDCFALALLDAASKDSHGAPHDLLAAELRRASGQQQPDPEKLGYLLSALQTDGYLMRANDQYRFVSPLLRDFWNSRLL